MAMHRCLFMFAQLILLRALSCEVSRAAEDVRYVGVLTNGSRIEGKELSGWSAGTERLKLDGTELFGSPHSLRWLRDRALPPTQTAGDAAPVVEFTNGDRLPGSVTCYEPLRADYRFDDRGHLVVVLAAPLNMPGRPNTLQLRVLPRFVRRIAWRRSEGAFPPSTLVYRDGREVSYQALRWQHAGVEVLVQDGMRQVAFTELAEVVLPQADPWQAYCAELSRTNPDMSAPLVRLETAGGMIVTASESTCRRGGKETEKGNWYYLLWPAWSLDVVPVMFAAVRTRWHFAPHELPLWRLRPVRVVERPLLGQGRPWQADRNVQRGPLRSKTEEHGWGFGVHAPYELWFEVPRHAQAFRTRVGLDALAGEGGCARALVYLNKRQGTPLYRSDLLIGSAAMADTGNLALSGPGEGPKTLVLVADAAAREGPPAADPLDIRDMLDWIEPMLLLDGERLKADVQARNDALLTGDGWTVTVEGGAAPRWRTSFAEVEPRLIGLLRGISTEGRPLTLARQQEVPAKAEGLLLAIREASGGGGGRLDVRVDGRPVARCGLPFRDQKLPLFVSLKPYRGRKINLEIICQPDGELMEVPSLAWARRADLSFWKPAAASEAWSLFGQLPVQAESDGTVRVGRVRPDTDIQVVRVHSGLRQIHGFRLEFMPEGELFNPGDPTDVFRLGVTLAVAPRRREPVPGRYVRIEVPPGATHSLSLAEVEVYRDSVTPPGPKEAEPKAKDLNAKPEPPAPPRPDPLNMARKGTASQSSVDGDSVPQRAIDGGRAAARTRSADNGDPGPWWEVDLGAVQPIDRIVVLKDQNWKNKFLWHRKPYWVLVLDDRRNTVWRTYVDGLLSMEDLPVMAHRNVLVGPRLPNEVPPNPDPIRPDTQHLPTYWTTRRRAPVNRSISSRRCRLSCPTRSRSWFR